MNESSKKLKVLFCLASLGSGGAERVVSLLANRFDSLGHQVQILCLKYDDVYYKVNDRVEVVLVTKEATSYCSRLFWLRRYVKIEKPDVVIAFTEGVYCFTLFSLLGTKIPVVASERLDPNAMSWNRKLLKKLLLPYAKWLVVQTQEIKKYFSPQIQRKTSIIFNPVNEEVLNYREKIENKREQIISVARLYPQKNQKMLIDAFGRIAHKYPSWQLVIYGEGPLRQDLEQLIIKKQLGGRVFLPGRTDKVIPELAHSKIFALSSNYEGMSNSMIEAICMGLPVVSTRVSGTEELIQNGINGFLVERNDADGMAQAFEKLISNEKLRIHIGKTNIENTKFFLIDTVVNKWLELIWKIKGNES